MGQCWGSLISKIRDGDSNQEEGCLMEMGFGEFGDSEYWNDSQMCRENQLIQLRPDQDKNVYHEQKQDRGSLLGLNRRTEPERLSVRYLEFPSKSPVFRLTQDDLKCPEIKKGSVTSLDLEWDSQDCFIHKSPPDCIGDTSVTQSSSETFLRNQDSTPLLSLDNHNCSVLYTCSGTGIKSHGSSATSLVWDGQADTQVEGESDNLQLDTETETLLQEIEELTSAALKETNHWSLHVNHETQRDNYPETRKFREQVYEEVTNPLVTVIKRTNSIQSDSEAATPMSISTSSSDTYRVISHSD